MTRPRPDWPCFTTCSCGAVYDVTEGHVCQSRPGTIRLIDLELAAEEADRRAPTGAPIVYAIAINAILIGIAAALIWA